MIAPRKNLKKTLDRERRHTTHQYTTRLQAGMGVVLLTVSACNTFQYTSKQLLSWGCGRGGVHRLVAPSFRSLRAVASTSNAYHLPDPSPNEFMQTHGTRMCCAHDHHGHLPTLSVPWDSGFETSLIDRHCTSGNLEVVAGNPPRSSGRHETRGETRCKSQSRGSHCEVSAYTTQHRDCIERTSNEPMFVMYLQADSYLKKLPRLYQRCSTRATDPLAQ